MCSICHIHRLTEFSSIILAVNIAELADFDPNVGARSSICGESKVNVIYRVPAWSALSEMWWSAMSSHISSEDEMLIITSQPRILIGRFIINLRHTSHANFVEGVNTSPTIPAPPFGVSPNMVGNIGAPLDFGSGSEDHNFGKLDQVVPRFGEPDRDAHNGVLFALQPLRIHL